MLGVFWCGCKCCVVGVRSIGVGKFGFVVWCIGKGKYVFVVIGEIDFFLVVGDVYVMGEEEIYVE